MDFRDEKIITAWKVSKYRILSGPYFPVFGLNTEKYWPEKTLYLDTFLAVNVKIWGKLNRRRYGKKIGIKVRK